MIFVTVGSQKFQFNRLLKKVDELIERGIIEEDVFAQIGVSDYKPKSYKYIDFTTREQFANNLDKCDLLITHAGTGVIVTALKKGKKVIAVPRLAKYGEHVDNHQIEIVERLSRSGLIQECEDADQLGMSVVKAQNSDYNQYCSNTETIINSIEKFIEMSAA